VACLYAASGAVVRAQTGQGEGGGVMPECLYVLNGWALWSAPKEDAGNGAGQDQVSNLGDDGNGGKAGVDVCVEAAVGLARFDRPAEPFEQTAGQGAYGWLGVCRFPVDQLSCEKEREVRIRSKDRDLARHDRRDNGFRHGIPRDSTRRFSGNLADHTLQYLAV
jgi:hypothetical protein